MAAKNATKRCSSCKAPGPLYPQRSDRNSPLRSAGGVLLIVVSVPPLVGALFMIVGIVSQREMGERDPGVLIIGVLGLLVATPLALAGMKLARSDLMLVCDRCRTPQRS